MTVPASTSAPDVSKLIPVPPAPPTTTTSFEPPIEIIHMIIEACTLDNPYRPLLAKPTLEACTLISQNWRIVAQSFLFRHMHIQDTTVPASRFLESTPGVGAHVRHLRISNVQVCVDDLHALLRSVLHLRYLALYRVWIIDAHVFRRRSFSDRHSIGTLECSSFGLEHGVSNFDQLFGLLSLFTSIGEIWMHTGIDEDTVVSNPVVIDRDAVVAAVASKLGVPGVHSIRLWGEPASDFAIPVVPFLCEIGAMRRLQHVDINVASEESLVRLNDLLCFVGRSLRSLSIRLRVYDVDKIPRDSFLTDHLHTGLSACKALDEFNITLYLEHHTGPHEHVLTRYWTTVANTIPSIPTAHLRHLCITFNLPAHPHPHVDPAEVNLDTDSALIQCIYKVHELPWSTMRRAVDAFPHLEFLAIWLDQDMEAFARGCVRYEMRQFRSVWVRENIEDLSVSVQAGQSGCTEHAGCKKYNEETYQSLRDPLASKST